MHHSHKQATDKKTEVGKEEKLDTEEDLRSKSSSTPPYVGKVSYCMIMSGEIHSLY